MSPRLLGRGLGGDRVFPPGSWCPPVPNASAYNALPITRLPWCALPSRLCRLLPSDTQNWLLRHILLSSSFCLLSSSCRQNQLIPSAEAGQKAEDQKPAALSIRGRAREISG